MSRLSILAIAALAVWLFPSAAVTHAAPAPEHAATRLVGDLHAQTKKLRKLLRHARSRGGPVAAKPRRMRLALDIDPSDRVQRAKRTQVAYDAAAIQNDAPAAHAETDDQPLPSLRPLGYLVGDVDSRARTHAFSPRPPRGPPPSR